MAEENNQNQGFNPNPSFPNQNPPSPYPTQNQNPYQPAPQSSQSYQPFNPHQSPTENRPPNPFPQDNQVQPQQSPKMSGNSPDPYSSDKPGQNDQEMNQNRGRTTQPYSPFNQNLPENNPFVSRPSQPNGVNQEVDHSAEQNKQFVYDFSDSLNHQHKMHDPYDQSMKDANSPTTFQSSQNKPDFKPTIDEGPKKEKKPSKAGIIISIIIIIFLSGGLGGLGFYTYTLYNQNQDLQSENKTLQDNTDPLRLQNKIESLENDVNNLQSDFDDANAQIQQKDQQIVDLETALEGEAPQEVNLEQAQQIALEVMNTGNVTDSNATTDFGAAWKVEVTISSGLVVDVYISSFGKVLKVIPQ